MAITIVLSSYFAPFLTEDWTITITNTAETPAQAGASFYWLGF